MGGYSAHPLSGIAISVQGPVQQTLVSSEDGGFRFENLLPGDYEIDAALPSLYTNTHPFKLTLTDQACASVEFRLRIDGRIGGRLFDSEGRPLANKTVELERADFDPAKPWSRYDARITTDDKGDFHFDSLAPDRYILGANIRFPSLGPNTYPPTYYPGVPDRATADVIQLAPAQHIEDLRLVLLPPLPPETATQRLTVRWPDGRPASGAQVSLTDRRWPEYHFGEGGGATDSFGRAELKVRNDETYEIYVFDSESGKQACALKFVTIDASAGDLAPLLIVLDHNSGKCSRKGLEILSKKSIGVE